MKKKRFLNSLLLTLLITQFASLLIVATPQVAKAATAEWVDVAHIKVDNETYSDNSQFDSMDYWRNGDEGGCNNVVKGFNRDFEANLTGSDITQAHLHTCKKDSETGKEIRTDDSITIGQPDNFKIWLYWVDAETLEAATVDGTLFRFDKEKNKFVGQNSGDCHPSVIVNNDTEARIELRIPAEGSCREAGSFDVKIAASSVGNRAIEAGKGSPKGSGGKAAEKPSCESKGGEMSWLLCPVLNYVSSFLQDVDNHLNRLLQVPNKYFEGEGEVQLRASWSRMRNLAFIVLVPITLVMVIGTALGFEFVSAYTVKKALPRLVIAVIFITLSFEITRLLIVITNDLGRGILGLLTSSISGEQEITLAQLFSPGSSEGLAFTFVIGVAGALALGALMIILSYAFVIGLVLFAALLLLALRQVLLVALVVLAPVAILAWIFPGNDKLWKLWWGTFSKLLLLYPIVMILIGAGRIFALLVQKVG